MLKLCALPCAVVSKPKLDLENALGFNRPRQFWLTLYMWGQARRAGSELQPEDLQRNESAEYDGPESFQHYLCPSEDFRSRFHP